MREIRFLDITSRCSRQLRLSSSSARLWNRHLGRGTVYDRSVDQMLQVMDTFFPGMEVKIDT